MLKKKHATMAVVLRGGMARGGTGKTRGVGELKLVVTIKIVV